MADNNRVQQELNNQLQGIDPFAVARNKAEQQQQAMGPTPVAPNFNFQQSLSSAPPQEPKLQSLFKDTGNLTMSEMDQQIQKMMQQLKLDNKTVNFTSVGQMNLQNQLKAKYGDKFEQNKDVKPLLDLFNKRLSSFSNDAAQKHSAMLSSAERTLNFLKGMG